MNRFLITVILSFFFSNTTFSQGSLTETHKLVHLSKVWGFLKYYHPQVAKGELDWDQELIRILPQVRNVNTQEDLSLLFTTWVESLGKIKKCKKCDYSTTKSFDKNFDLTWISDSNTFSNKLISRLKEVESNRYLGKKHYVAYLYKNPSAAAMVNETVFGQDSWKHADIRLVTLFRYWNFVEYFFPYKYQTDKPWDEVLEYFIPVFLNAETETDFHLALLELVASIDDSHGKFFTDKTFAYFGDKFLPVTITYKDGVGIVTGFYNDSLASLDDFKMGDLITKVEGKDVSTLYKSVEKYICGSNESVKKSQASNYIFNGNSDTVHIEISREGKLYAKTVHRYAYKDLNYIREVKPSYEILAKNLGYINMGELEKEDVADVFNKIMTTDGLILDFRNGAKSTWHLIIDYISSQEKEFCKIIYPDLNYPGKYILHESSKCGKNSPLKYSGKVILLVNEHTQSHSEYSVMSLQTGDHVITVGSTTSGADGNTTPIPLIESYKTRITGTGIFYPDMTETQRKGVKIDYLIESSVKGISENKDELLEMAIQLLMKL